MGQSDYRIEHVAITILLVCLAVLMMVAAVCRHLFPAYHAVPLRAAAACLTWLVSFGMSLAAATGQHIRVTCFTEMAGPKVAALCRALAEYCFILFAALMGLLGLLVVVASWSRSGFGAGPFIYAGLPIGSVLTIYRLIRRRWRDGRMEAAGL